MVRRVELLKRDWGDDGRIFYRVVGSGEFCGYANGHVLVNGEVAPVPVMIVELRDGRVIESELKLVRFCDGIK